jgi:hypothetical protein
MTSHRPNASEVYASGHDEYDLADTGSSTLTTNGHVYGNDSYNYQDFSVAESIDNQFSVSMGEANVNNTSISGFTSSGPGGTSYESVTWINNYDTSSESGDTTDHEGNVTPLGHQPLQPVGLGLQLAPSAVAVDLGGIVSLSPPIIGGLSDADLPTDV